MSTAQTIRCGLKDCDSEIRIALGQPVPQGWRILDVQLASLEHRPFARVAICKAHAEVPYLSAVSHDVVVGPGSRENVAPFMFVIGAPAWPGIAKLAEECGELIQVIGKLVGSAGARFHWDGSDLHKRLVEEMGDVDAALDFVAWACENSLDRQEIAKRSAQKRRTFHAWHNGRYTPPPRDQELRLPHLIPDDEFRALTGQPPEGWTWLSNDVLGCHAGDLIGLVTRKTSQPSGTTSAWKWRTMSDDDLGTVQHAGTEILFERAVAECEVALGQRERGT